MTHQEIKELAGHRAVSPWVMKLVNDAVMKEREACALLCEEERINATHYSAPTQSNWLAKKIRAR
jgi:hypothetical protein